MSQRRVYSSPTLKMHFLIWETTAENRNDAQVAFSTMKLSCFEFTISHVHLWPKKQLASAAAQRYELLPLGIAASAKLYFLLSSPEALIEKYTYYINYASPAQGILCTPL